MSTPIPLSRPTAVVYCDHHFGRIDGKTAIHSAKVAYGPDGIYGAGDAASERAMQILYSDEANETTGHPLVREHPETGREGIFGCAGYVCGIDAMEPDEGWALLVELLAWQTRPEFQYRHRWSENMLVMWDNRSVLHMATGGYDGHERLLHRTTIGAAS